MSATRRSTFQVDINSRLVTVGYATDGGNVTVTSVTDAKGRVVKTSEGERQIILGIARGYAELDVEFARLDVEEPR